MKTVKKVNYKYNIIYKFPSPFLDDSLKLAKRSPPDNLDVFRKDYGRILGYLEAYDNEYQRDAIHTLLQFYDRTLRCFVFPDYLLAPTLEEYSSILDIPILHQVPFHASMKKLDATRVAVALYLSESIVKANFKKKGSVCGYPLGFLLKEAGGMDEKEDWRPLNVFLACCIYGIVLFSNEVKFVDENVVAIFIQRNHVPTLLRDVYHFIYSRSFKGNGVVVHYYAPLLYQWFRSQLPCQRAFLDTQDTLKLSQRMKGLTSKDIDWYNHSLNKLENKEVIFSYGEFPNVPLMGMRSGINYNPSLSLRKLGYALKIPLRTKTCKNPCFMMCLIVLDGRKELPRHGGTFI
ncbi:uncharacterized protein LOC127122765 [Lathyrus oleraceus]|uniref:uncharacterized protein LOC127122765 n=1 Tax=Pisum sativum TaxID=3888 RepID=UPI0021CF24BC|nr:uncharacterized protein LOC127122765 [Pisum sativum]